MPWVSRSLLFITVTIYNPIDSQFTKFPAVNNEFSIKTKIRPTSFRFHEGFQSQSSSRFSTNIQNKPTTRLNLFGTRFNDVRNSQAEEDGSPSGSGVPIPVITTTTDKSNLEDKLSSSFSVFRCDKHLYSRLCNSGHITTLLSFREGLKQEGLNQGGLKQSFQI